MKLQLRSMKGSGETYVVDLDAMLCSGPVSDAELIRHPDLNDYNTDDEWTEADTEQSFVDYRNTDVQ